MDIEEKVEFWRREAREALRVSQSLLRLKHYVEALFFGHLALEKLLKAKIIEKTHKEPIYSHDLVLLSKHAKLKLSESEIDFLVRINIYNIRARYQDYKRALYKRANKQWTQKELSQIRLFFNHIHRIQ